MGFKKPKKCKECGLWLQVHFYQTYFVIAEPFEINGKYYYDQTYKVDTGKPRKVIYTCNNDKCSLNK